MDGPQAVHLWPEKSTWIGLTNTFTGGWDRSLDGVVNGAVTFNPKRFPQLTVAHDGVSGIYLIYCVGNEKFYIGQSKDLWRRRRFHLYFLRKGCGVNPKLQRSFDKYGEDSFQFYILELTTLERLTEREQDYVDALVPWFNIGLTVDNPNRGRPLSAEHRLKISVANTGKLRGRKHTSKARANMSAAQRGKKHGPHSATTRAKISAAVRGFKHTAEVRAKMSIARRGKPLSVVTRTKISAVLRGRVLSVGMLGKRHSPETKARMSDAWIKRKQRFPNGMPLNVGAKIAAAAALRRKRKADTTA